MGEAGRIRVAIVGAGREGLETLSLLSRDKTISVPLLFDTAKEALGFRLAEYGYTYATDLNLRLSHRMRELATIQDLSLVVDTAPDRYHNDLYGLDIYPAEIISGHSARFVWELKYIEEIDKRRSFITDQINNVLETTSRGLQSAPQASSIDEPGALLLRTSFLGTHATSVQLTVLGKDEPCKVIKDIHIDPGLLIKKESNRPCLKERDKADPIIEFVVENKRTWEGSGDEAGGWAAIYVIPIIEGSDVVGILWFFYESSTANFATDDIAFISSLIPLFGKTIRGAIEAEGLRLTSVEEALSVKSLNIIGSEKSIGAKLKDANDTLFKLLRAEDSHLYIRDPATGDLVLQATTHKFPYLLGRIRIKKGHGILGEVIERGGPLVLTEAGIDNSNGQRHRFAKREDNITLLYLPLLIKDKGVGIIAMEFTNIHNITPNVYNALGNIGHHLANTISSDVERYRMSQKIIKLSTVNEEGIELLSTSDLQKVFALATATSAMLLDSEVSILRLYGNGELIVHSTYGIREDKVAQTLLDLDNNIATMISQTKIPALVHDVLEYTDMTLDHDFPYKTGIAVPILFNKELFGTLSLYNKTASEAFSSLFFTEDDREILEHFIQYVARGVVNARRYSEKQLLITIDEETGLRNERYLQMRFPEEIKRAGRFNRSVSLIFFEVKPVDDYVIQEIAKMAKETFRYIDVLVRLKEAKFAALLPDTGEGVKDAVKRLSASFNRLKEKRPDLTLYAGYTTYPDDGDDMQELIKRSSRLRQY